jgi:hypothetical protein
MMRLLRNITLATLTLTGVAVICAPAIVLADNAASVVGSFSVSYTYPSAVAFCAPADGDVSIEAQGLGRLSGVGPVLVTVAKCLRFSDLRYIGTFTITARNGDTLRGTYLGTQNAANENGFGPFHGVLRVTGGTGQFQRLRGDLEFGAVASPASSGVNPETVVGTAYYILEGTLRRR